MNLKSLEMERIGKYLAVRKHAAADGRRTHRWSLVSNGGDVLGAICWFPRWRQYCFDPVENAVFNNQCLRDLAAFLERANRAHHDERREAAP